MTRSTALGMLRVGNTGDEMLQILDALIENEGDNITTDAVDFSGNPVNLSLIHI